ncbi:plexin-B1-like [Clupea harengus]|uniref:Plexin-B1-like n=1 Tax=Clupea harengus TaxID=7950 RepID=A0A8M1KBW5_CLUHA|nr:plexin-B1-like [Clupea harengus]
MTSWLSVTVALLCVCARNVPCTGTQPFWSRTNIQSVVRDPQTGRVYVGATNNLYQLGPNLALEQRVVTGPKLDNVQCSPPITESCSDVKQKENENRLLLVYPGRGALIACGSVYRGVCSLLNLTDISHTFYYSEIGGKKTWVARGFYSITGLVSSVRLKRRSPPLDVLLVAKNFASLDGTDFLSVRGLRGEGGKRVVFESVAELPFASVSTMQDYSHEFYQMFQDGEYVYIVFTRLAGSKDSKGLTFVARFCTDDIYFYSYLELPLTCGGEDMVWAANVASAGPALARHLSESGEHGSTDPADKVLFGVFGPELGPARLCLYPLGSINRAFEEIRNTCYVHEGMAAGKEVVYQPYSSRQENPCRSKSLQTGMAVTYPCGDASLPDQLAGRRELALHSQSVFTWTDIVRAVAVVTETRHTVVFLGTTAGEVLKVHISNSAVLYDTIAADNTRSGINQNIFFDKNHSNVYVTSYKMIRKVPVQSCHLLADCQSCMSLRDPYCGWCVLEGRCSTEGDCGKAEEKNMWLWSPDQQCVTIQTFKPPFLSCLAQSQMVEMDIPLLPALKPGEKLECEFGSFHSSAQTQGTRVTCSLPEPTLIGWKPQNQDYVVVPVKIRVTGGVELVTGEFRFYSCAAVVGSEESRPCMTCVMSDWGCQWDTDTQACSDIDQTAEGAHIIKHRQTEKCPIFESPTPALISVGVKTPVSFVGRNLKTGKHYKIGTKLVKQFEDDVAHETGSKFNFRGFKFIFDEAQEVNVSLHVTDPDSGKRIDSTVTVLLYNCSVERDDCSVCQSAEAKYRCVWCSASQTCVHRDLCTEVQDVCATPTITDVSPRSGPMEGLISITIRGHNLGVTAQDIHSITVAKIPCIHQPHRYSPSVRVVCEIGPVQRPSGDSSPLPGPVVLELRGGRKARSSLLFTYQDPQPESFTPTSSLFNGGRVLTVSGSRLDTGSKEDVRVLVGEHPCQILSVGPQITCKMPAMNTCWTCNVTVKYGKNTTKELPGIFSYTPPFLLGHTPEQSFACGGRVISFRGFLSMVEKASITAAPPAGDTGADQLKEEEAFSKSPVMLQFRSPDVRGVHNLRLINVFLHLDGLNKSLTPFTYHPDPEFNALSPNPISASNTVTVTGRGFSKAMTAEEAEAFIGNIPCHIISLQDDRLVLQVPPTVIEKRQSGEMESTLEVKIKFGYGEWMVREPERRSVVVPVAVAISILLPLLLLVSLSVYFYMYGATAIHYTISLTFIFLRWDVQ